MNRIPSKVTMTTERLKKYLHDVRLLSLIVLCLTFLSAHAQLRINEILASNANYYIRVVIWETHGKKQLLTILKGQVAAWPTKERRYALAIQTHSSSTNSITLLQNKQTKYNWEDMTV